MPQPFLDISFPPFVARGATGGPSFSTNVAALASGAEERNILWANARGKWNISTGIRTREQMLDVIAFFHVAKGRGYSFRFKDWNDYAATDQLMAEVTPTVWQLVKRYAIGGFEHVRTIAKPVSGTVAVKIGGVPTTPSGIDYLTGRVTFASTPPSAPTASFEFDVPVRFDTDHLPVQAQAFDQQVVSQIDLIEVRE
ncbi:MAG: TIGR02217 family protein [Pseudorhodoplanes sp.]|nr:TIGR02217 family protein [Pseudorhodoplanes sp.]